MPLFGEVVEPVSRALYIDESSDDEESQDIPATNIELLWANGDPGNFQTFLIFHGQLATEFLMKVLQGVNAAAALHLKENRKPMKNTRIMIYQISQDVFGCFCPIADITTSSLVLGKLVPVFSKCQQVVVVATMPAPFYKGNDPTLDLPPAFMRVLYTSTFENVNSLAPSLEQPNMVTGVPASVLNWCEIFKKPGALYVCYSDSHHLDSISAEPLVNLFLQMFHGLYESKVLSFQSIVQEPTSNLYM